MYTSSQTPFDTIIPREYGDYITVPNYVPGKLNITDYVNFLWDSSLDSTNYKIIVQAPNASHEWMRIGSLATTAKLPEWEFQKGLTGASQIAIVPIDDSSNDPRFIGYVVRGGTYQIDPRARISVPISGSKQGFRALRLIGGIVV